MRILCVGMILCSSILACSTGGKVPIDRAVVTVGGQAPTLVCRSIYRGLNREAPCDQVATAMQSEWRIPMSARIVVQPSKETRYEELGRLIQSLSSAGYVIEFPSR